MKRPDTHKMQVVFPIPLFEKLQAMADKEGVSKSEIIRDCLKFKFYEMEKKRENNT